MSVSIINPGVSGITVETDPTALKLTGGAISGDLTVAQKVGIGGVVPVGANNKLAVHNGNIVFTSGFGLAFGDGTTQTTAALPLTGGTLTGRVVFPNRTAGQIAHLNLGTVADNLTVPTTLVEGDIFFHDTDATGGYNVRLAYTAKSFSGTLTNYSLAVLQNQNFFTQPQTISCSHNSQPALRVTQLGTGEAIRVEDSTNPDATPFIVANNGQTVIGGLTPYSTASLTVNGGASIESGSYYVRVDSNGVGIYGTLVLTNQTTVSGTTIFSDYNNDIAVNVNGQTIYIPYRV